MLNNYLQKLSPAMQRVVTGTLLIIALAIVLAIGGWFAGLAATACLVIALHEELNTLRQGGYQPVSWTSYAALILGAVLVLWHSSMVILPLLVVLIFAVQLCVMRREEPSLPDIMVSVLPMLTLVLPGLCLVGLLDTQPRALQLMLLVFVFTTSVGGDTFAYLVGSTLGGPKLCPKISPKKTISGAIGGLLGSVVVTLLAGLIFRWCVPDFFNGLPMGWAALAGLFGGIAAQMGDLFASMVKRHCKVKDFGTIFPGHGGMMDRLDSILFTSIVIFCYRAILLGLL